MVHRVMETALIAIFLSAYAAFVGTCALIWQVVSWSKSRKPDVTLTAGHETGPRAEDSGINVRIVPSNDVTVVGAGISPRQRWRQRLFNEMKVKQWAVDGSDWNFDEFGRGLPRGLRSTSVLNIWFSEQEIGQDGVIGYKDGRDYIAWIQTSKGHIHVSNVFGGDQESSWRKFS